MSKTAWYWVGGIVVVVIVAGVIWMVAGKGSGPGMYGSGQLSSGNAEQTMQGLLSSGATETCTFSRPATASSTTSTTGTIYVASGNMRGDFTTTDSAGKVINAHMIVTAGTSYVWTDQMAQGFKMSWSSMASSTAMAHQPGSVDVNEPTSYSCSPWVADQTEFTLPTNITFSDMSAMMGAGAGAVAPTGVTGAGTSASGSASACAACANVPAAYQAECRTAMHC